MWRTGSCDFCIQFIAFFFLFSSMQFSFASLSFLVHTYVYGQVFQLVILPLQKKEKAVKRFKKYIGCTKWLCYSVLLLEIFSFKF